MELDTVCWMNPPANSCRAVEGRCRLWDRRVSGSVASARRLGIEAGRRHTGYTSA